MISGRLILAIAVLAAFEGGTVVVAAWFLIDPPRTNGRISREAEAYATYSRLFGVEQLSPAECRSEADLVAVERALAGPLAPPQEYAVAWQETPAVALYRKWVTDAALVRRLQNQSANWYRNQIRRSQAIFAVPTRDGDWAVTVSVLLMERPPLPASGPVTESPVLPGPQGAALDFRDIHDSDHVELAERHWHEARRHLLAWPDYCELALRLIGWPAAFPQPEG